MARSTEKNRPFAVIHCFGQTLSAPTHTTLVFDFDVTHIDQAKFAELSLEERSGLVLLITKRSRLGYVNAKRILFGNSRDSGILGGVRRCGKTHRVRQGRGVRYRPAVGHGAAILVDPSRVRRGATFCRSRP